MLVRSAISPLFCALYGSNLWMHQDKIEATVFVLAVRGARSSTLELRDLPLILWTNYVVASFASLSG
jgi:hypothetical protein